MSEENKPTSTETKTYRWIHHLQETTQRGAMTMWLIVGMVTDYLVPFMEPFIVIPDKPLLEVDISGRPSIEVSLDRTVSGDPSCYRRKFLTLSHINTLLLYISITDVMGLGAQTAFR
jgi:hypothetical protein